MPGESGVKSPDVAEPIVDSTLVVVNTWVVHAASLNRRKDTLPVGA